MGDGLTGPESGVLTTGVEDVEEEPEPTELDVVVGVAVVLTLLVEEEEVGTDGVEVVLLLAGTEVVEPMW